MNEEERRAEIARLMGRARVHLGMHMAAVAVMVGDDYAVTMVMRHKTKPGLTLLLSMEEGADGQEVNPMEVKDRIDRALTELLSKDDLSVSSHEGLRRLNNQQEDDR